MRSIFIFLLLGAIACHSSAKNEHPNVNAIDPVTSSNGGCSPEIIHSGMAKWYDEAKWTLYCIYCDDTCRFDKTGIKDTVTFSSLDLKFEGIEQFHDTIEMRFSFFYHDTLKCDVTNIRNPELASGAAFRKGRDSIIYYTSSSTFHRFWENSPTSRYTNPLQPEVIAYIKANEHKLDPWFRAEARRRGILNQTP